MTLILRAVALDDQPLTQPITAQFDAHGGTIGRADHNTLALPDPERHISREQAEIVAFGTGFVIRNVGSSNPILVHDQPLARGESAPLAHLDQVRIGRYLLEVCEEPATTLHGGPLPAPAPSAAATPWPARLPEDFDPFAPPAAPAARAQAAAQQGVFDDLVPAAAASSIDDVFGLQGGSGGDPLAAFLADVQPATPAAAPLPSTDPLVLFGAPAQAPPPPELTPDRTPELRAPFTPPRPVAARPAESPAPRPVQRPPERAAERPSERGPERTPADASVPADAAALWNAFCEGAGVRVPAPQGATPELLHCAGAVLRAAIDGTLQLIAVRAATRHELHAQVTVIQARNNNPLKFSPDGQAALEQLLQPPVRGFLPGPAAVTEAMDDLVGHAIGAMAGTRAALEGVLERFAPGPLQDKLAGATVIDSVLPMARKAKLWELYLQHHQAIREEAQEDFHALFGKAFVQAYEQQLERLRRERPRA
jgi:FHA domain-containing protein